MWPRSTQRWTDAPASGRGHSRSRGLDSMGLAGHGRVEKREHDVLAACATASRRSGAVLEVLRLVCWGALIVRPRRGAWSSRGQRGQRRLDRTRRARAMQQRRSGGAEGAGGGERTKTLLALCRAWAPRARERAEMFLASRAGQRPRDESGDARAKARQRLAWVCRW